MQRKNLKSLLIQYNFINLFIDFQNVNAKAVVDEYEVENLIDQMVSPSKWSESIMNMISIGAKNFTEIGPGKVLCGLIKKINRDVLVEST